MGTPLQKLYTRFQTKIDEDIIGKEGLIFSLVDVAITKSSKTCRHNLNYTLDDPIYDEENNIINDYEGSFDNDLDNDEIELLALWMKYEWKERKVAKLDGQRKQVGTSDFNRLEGKKDEMLVAIKSSEKALEEVKSFMQEFNTYKYS
jgi:hypothetical protein